jgi:lysozyme family protein
MPNFSGLKNGDNLRFQGLRLPAKGMPSAHLVCVKCAKQHCQKYAWHQMNDFGFVSHIFRVFERYLDYGMQFSFFIGQ